MGTVKLVKATVIPQQGLKEKFFIEEFHANLLGGSTLLCIFICIGAVLYVVSPADTMI